MFVSCGGSSDAWHGSGVHLACHMRFDHGCALLLAKGSMAVGASLHCAWLLAVLLPSLLRVEACVDARLVWAWKGAVCAPSRERFALGNGDADFPLLLLVPRVSGGPFVDPSTWPVLLPSARLPLELLPSVSAPSP
eukprot:CAMPEP_0118959194 /NCGR_PEP_ID=MMETSP1169-20130426/63006_1 /TAXON_ID=36882 /ORGANISM="Pyramimonas obovata, Strain CCMP722" /LENGTH=135 /DNA_ID=CAMNT_0006907323 /DNA_START=436 /DNA_END=843 /DNA_ORIENTATION=+